MTRTQIQKELNDSSYFFYKFNDFTKVMTIFSKIQNGNICGIDMPFIVKILDSRVWSISTATNPKFGTETPCINVEFTR